MLNRVALFLITAFWITMNVLLWRSEFRGDNEVGAAVPVEVVWQRMLVAPDDSELDIIHHGKRVGYCRWSANAAEALATGKFATDDTEPEGQVRHLTGYTIDITGNFAYGEAMRRMRFDSNLQFSTNYAWREFMLRGNQRPTAWEVRGDAKAETLAFKIQEGNSDWDRTFKFDELRNPEKLVHDMGGPLVLGMVQSMVQNLGNTNQLKEMSIGLQWEARHDWFKIAHSKLRAYRIQARVLDRYQIVVYVSRVGEILRVELPNDVVLINTAFTSL